jgi:lysophospholipase L1-like esterase
VSRGRKWLFALVPALSLLLLGECGARVVGAECEAIEPAATGWETMVGDARYLWKLEPGRLFESPAGNTRINSVGLRTPHLPTDPQHPNLKTVLVTGDSSVYGWGQPDGKTYAEQLESLLGRAFKGQRFRVVNLGVPGYSTEQTLLLLEDLGWSYEPDLVIVHNIFSDCNIDAFQDRTALRLANPDATASQRLLHSSALYCAIYQPWAEHIASINQQPNRVLMPGIPTGANQAAALEKIDTIIDLSRVPLDHYLDNLEAIQEGASALGATMMLAPLAQEWDVGVWNVPMAEPTADQVLPWFPYRDAQIDWAAEHGVELVSMPEAFAAAPGDKTRLFIDNMHPSVTGAAVMAQALVVRLRANPALLGLTASDVKADYRAPALPQGNGVQAPGGHGGLRAPGGPQGPPLGGAPPPPPRGPGPGGH